MYAFGGVSRIGLLEHRDNIVVSHNTQIFLARALRALAGPGVNLGRGERPKQRVRGRGLLVESRELVSEHSDNRIVSHQTSDFSHSRSQAKKRNLVRERGQNNEFVDACFWWNLANLSMRVQRH